MGDRWREIGEEEEEGKRVAERLGFGFDFGFGERAEERKSMMSNGI